MLPRVHNCLLLFQRSSRVTFETLKSLCNDNERMARYDRQLWFLRGCKESGLYPPTIDNIRLPTFMQHPRFSNEVHRMKTSLLAKLRRHLFAERHITQVKSSQTIQYVEDNYDDQTLNSVKHMSFITFDIAFEHHHQRLEKRLRWIAQRHHHERREGVYLEETDIPEDDSSLTHHLPELPCTRVSAETGNSNSSSFFKFFPSFHFPMFPGPQPFPESLDPPADLPQPTDSPDPPAALPHPTDSLSLIHI